MDNCRDEEDCPSKECKGKDCPSYQKPLPLDILAVLADFIPKINQICDQLHARSLVLEDAYCEAGDKANDIFDLCGELQENYVKIIQKEFDDDPS